MATFYLDPENGNDANDGTTFANRWKTITSGATAARIAPGDTIRIIASPDATSLGQSASWTDGSPTVTLTTAVTATLHDGETAWTASANVTCGTSTVNYRAGTKAATFTPATAFTTGKLAYAALGASTDLSAYKQLSLWYRSNGALSAGQLQIKLCSDTTGDTAVDTLSLPASTSNTWQAVTIEAGANFGSAIQSIALYATSDPGTTIVTLDQIIACKPSTSADALTLQSMIGKQTDGSDGWWPILSISGTTITLDASAVGTGPTSLPYRGTTESVTTYKRQPIMLSATGVGVVQDSGTDGSPITFSGGWNRTDMSTQTGETWLGYEPATSVNTYAQFDANSKNFIRLDKVFAFRGYGLYFSSAVFYGATAGTIGSAASYRGIHLQNTVGAQIDAFRQALGTDAGIVCDSVGHVEVSGIGKLHCQGEAINLLTTSRNCRFVGASGAKAYGNTYGVRQDYTSYGNRVFNIDFASNSVADIGAEINNARLSRIDLVNCKLNSTSAVLSSTGYIYSHKHQQTADTHKIYWRNSAGTIESATDQRHTASGIAWKFLPTHATNVNNVSPLSLSVAKVACAASTLRTVSIWMRRSNTGLSMRLRVPGGQIAGVASDVTSSITAAADTWEQVTVTFTPTEAGVVEVFAEAWGGTTYSGWVDDLSQS